MSDEKMNLNQGLVDSIGLVDLEKLLVDSAKRGAELALMENRKVDPGKSWIDKTEAMEMLNCSSSKLYRLVSAGEIRVNTSDKHARKWYSLDDLNKYISGGKKSV